MTSRRLEILSLMAEGLTNEEIAKRLQIGKQSVMSHVRGVLHELQARNRTHAVAIYLQGGGTLIDDSHQDLRRRVNDYSLKE